MQGMLDNLSQPVAFATVTLGNTEIPSGVKTPPTPRTPRRDPSDTDIPDEPMLSRLTRRIGIGRDSKHFHEQKGASTETTSGGDDDFEDGLFDEGSPFFHPVDHN